MRSWVGCPVQHGRLRGMRYHSTFRVAICPIILSAKLRKPLHRYTHRREVFGLGYNRLRMAMGLVKARQPGGDALGPSTCEPRRGERLVWSRWSDVTLRSGPRVHDLPHVNGVVIGALRDSSSDPKERS